MMLIQSTPVSVISSSQAVLPPMRWRRGLVYSALKSRCLDCVGVEFLALDPRDKPEDDSAGQRDKNLIRSENRANVGVVVVGVVAAVYVTNGHTYEVVGIAAVGRRPVITI